MKAIFVDRDGVINELVFHPEHGIIDSPAVVEEFNLLPGVGKTIQRLRQGGYGVILVSNQPGLAKKKMTRGHFEAIRQKMHRELAEDGGVFDGEYYCFHHPEATNPELRVICDCRKPGPGLLFRAANDFNIDLNQSWMIGDGITDVEAGKNAGCRTVLIGKLKCETCHMMDERDVRPDAIISSLVEAAAYIIGEGGQPCRYSSIPLTLPKSRPGST